MNQKGSNEKSTQICLKCGKRKKIERFSNCLINGKEFYCYQCRKKIVIDKQSLIDYLTEHNVGFSERLWGECFEWAKDKVLDTKYKDQNEYPEEVEKDIMSKTIIQYFKRRHFPQYLSDLEAIKKGRGNKNRRQKISKEKTNIKINKDIEITDELIDKWGFGYTDQEYIFFEKKYQLLKNNYSEKTAMHSEALKNYVRYRVKEEIATAEGNVKEAKEWGALASKAAQDAKINPRQLSKADLSDGLSTFSELSQAVEKEVDIISILPKFKYRPNDALDFNIWCYVNYMRDLSGLPLCNYEDVYKFYDKRVQDYIEQYGDPYGIFINDPTKENRKNVQKFIIIEDDNE